MVEFKNFLGGMKRNLDAKDMPKHVGFNLKGSVSYSKSKKIDYDSVFSGFLSNIKNIIQFNSNLKIPILSFYILGKGSGNSIYYNKRIRLLDEFLSDLIAWSFIYDNKIKFNVFGQWYNLFPSTIENIKSLLNETKDFDGSFVNLFINYDGQEEIVDACKIISKQVSMGKIDAESIDKDSVRENLYGSPFYPPDLIIKTGQKNSSYGFMLWDSVHTINFHSDTPWIDFSTDDFYTALEYYLSQKG